jgi:hypothetical protein
LTVQYIEKVKNDEIIIDIVGTKQKQKRNKKKSSKKYIRLNPNPFPAQFSMSEESSSKRKHKWKNGPTPKALRNSFWRMVDNDIKKDNEKKSVTKPSKKKKTQPEYDILNLSGNGSSSSEEYERSDESKQEASQDNTPPETTPNKSQASVITRSGRQSKSSTRQLESLGGYR